MYLNRWNLHKNIAWKPITSNSIVPSNSRPLTGNEEVPNGADFKARPIKHWRKQLIPISNNNSRMIGIPSDLPGGSVYLGQSNTGCSNCDESSNSHIIKENIYLITNSSLIGDKFYDSDNNKVVCIACNPENNRIKSAVTLINKKYYSDRKAYLKSRCLTYEQKLSTIKDPNVSYVDSEGNIIYPSNSSNGSQVRLSTNCSKACYDTSGNYTTSTTIYKPNNAQYGVQGAVSSGSRIDRLKYNIITKNGNSFRSAWGDEGANAGKYRGTTTPYFLKNKYQSCVNNRRNGNNKLCY